MDWGLDSGIVCVQSPNSILQLLHTQSNYQIIQLPDFPRSDVLVNDLLEVLFRSEADNRLDHLAGLEEQEGRDTADLKFEGGIRIIVDVEFPDRQLARII